MDTASLGLTNFLTVAARRPGAGRLQEHVRRAVELAVVLVGLLVAAPLIILFGIIVRLTSRGPALYTQERVGKGGKVFRIYKLRTMRIDAEAAGPVWAKEADPRVTPVGRFLRKTHLDELPQLLNVLRGDMSLVGPRPERPCFVEKLRANVPLYTARLAVKPGITGLAQVKHGYDRTIEDVQVKLGYDLEYIRRACLLFDLHILVLTAAKILAGRSGS